MNNIISKAVPYRLSLFLPPASSFPSSLACLFVNPVALPYKIRSHAQKYFLKVQKNGTASHVPPPRPKRKATHPYPQKAPQNALMPLQSTDYSSSFNSILPEFLPTWDEASILMNTSASEAMPSQDDLNVIGAEAEVFPRIVSSSVCGTGSSSRVPPKQGKEYLMHGIPDFTEVYRFIGSVFDPDTAGHVQKLKEMDPINVETVLLLMRNLTVNLSSPDSEPILNNRGNCWVMGHFRVGSYPLDVADGGTCPHCMKKDQVELARRLNGYSSMRPARCALARRSSAGLCPLCARARTNYIKYALCVFRLCESI